MYDPGMSVCLKVSTCLTEFSDRGFPESYVIQISGKIVSGEGEEEIGSVDVNLCRLGEAWEDNISVYDVLDSYATTAPYLELFGQGHGWSNAVGRACHTEGFPDLLVIERVEVKEEYRGRGIGLIAVQMCIKAFGMGCGVVALKPFPLQYEAGRDLVDKTEEDPIGFQLGIKKLTRYWARLGFKRLKNGLMVRDTTSKRTPLITQKNHLTTAL